MISSNGVCLITETEARLGDLLRDNFPKDGLDRDQMILAKIEFDEWASKNHIPRLSFWDYTPTKKKHPELHLVPTPHPGISNSDQFLVFSQELATRILTLGFIPKCSS